VSTSLNHERHGNQFHINWLCSVFGFKSSCIHFMYAYLVFVLLYLVLAPRLHQPPCRLEIPPRAFVLCDAIWNISCIHKKLCWLCPPPSIAPIITLAQAHRPCRRFPCAWALNSVWCCGQIGRPVHRRRSLAYNKNLHWKATLYRSQFSYSPPSLPCPFLW